MGKSVVETMEPATGSIVQARLLNLKLSAKIIIVTFLKPLPLNVALRPS